MTPKNIVIALSAFCRYALAVAAKIVLAVVGLVVVALALPFRAESGMPYVFSDPRFTHLGQWRLCRLPRWALWWDNPFDGHNGTPKDAAPEQRIKGVVCALSIWKAL